MCPVCGEHLQEDRHHPHGGRKLPCGHMMCTRCLEKWHTSCRDSWIRTTCPMCRAPIPTTLVAGGAQQLFGGLQGGYDGGYEDLGMALTGGRQGSTQVRAAASWEQRLHMPSVAQHRTLLEKLRISVRHGGGAVTERTGQGPSSMHQHGGEMPGLGHSESHTSESSKSESGDEPQRHGLQGLFGGGGAPGSAGGGAGGDASGGHHPFDRLFGGGSQRQGGGG